MPIGIRTPGAIHFFSRIRLQTIANYMGTCVLAPEPEHTKFRIPIQNDMGGRSVPFQTVYDGETAVVAATMNRFNGVLIQSLRALDGNALGTDMPRTRGTLTLGIKDFQLLLIYEYAGTPAAGSFAGASDLPGGRLYSSATIQKYKESTVGTRVQEIGIVFECNNILALPISTGAGQFGLFTENAALFGPREPIV